MNSELNLYYSIHLVTYQICHILRKKESKSPDFYDKFQWVPKNIKGLYFILFLKLSYLVGYGIKSIWSYG
jgi:hypothetical protein